jgi:excisionase family DNA binding protein
MPSPHNTPLFQPPATTLKQRGAAASNPPHHPPTHDQPEGPHSPVPLAAARPRELLRVEEAAARLAIGRTSMFALLRNRAIESVKVGRLRRVPADALTAYIARLVSDQSATA